MGQVQVQISILATQVGIIYIDWHWLSKLRRATIATK